MRRTCGPLGGFVSAGLQAKRFPRWVVPMLGLPSLALGAAPLLAAPGVARLIGLNPSPSMLSVLRLAGLRELVVAVLFLTRPSPLWMWAFLAQDAMDLSVAVQVLVRKLPLSTRQFRKALGVYAFLALTDVVVTLWARPWLLKPASGRP
jgi:hypothetical protein